MTIAQVLYVLEIADCRSISAAAERQFISQSALSQQIQRLEGELGYPLFVRTPRGLTLTAAGETFCREARPVARMLDRGMIYSDILAETSASSATISRVNRCLTGGTGGYERAFAKVDAEEKK